MQSYLTLLGESTYTFEKSAYIIGIVDSEQFTYIGHHATDQNFPNETLSEVGEKDEQSHCAREG